MFPEEVANLQLRGQFTFADMLSWVQTVGFVFLNQHFSLENLEDLETLISPLHGDNCQWELSSWPPFNGSCVSYSCFNCIFFYQPPLFTYLICLSSLGGCIGLCNPLLCRDCPSHPSLPIQLLVIIHDSSQMSTYLFPKNCLWILPLLNTHNISHTSFVAYTVSSNNIILTCIVLTLLV